MAGVKLTYHGQVLSGLENEINYRLHRIGTLVSGEVRRALSKPSRTSGGKDRNRAGRFTKSKRVHSAPGEPPRADTGTLRKSITFDVDKANHVVRIGTPVFYGRFLEEGTARMKARPYLRSTIRKLESLIIQQLTRPIRGKRLPGRMM